MPSIVPGREHLWKVSVEDACDIQRRLAALVEVTPLPTGGLDAPGTAAGVDVGYSRDGMHAWACAVVMNRAFQVLDRVIIPGIPDAPYRRGLLAFREGRLSIEALCALSVEPDIVFCDGHGIVHERGCGLASHVGVLLDIPVIGVPKTPFHPVKTMPEAARGSFTVLTKEWGAEGAAVRLRSAVKPVYVSPGHRVDLPSAIALCMAWSTGHHKVPEPLQEADTLSRLARRNV